jgi:hypothetical protein
MKICDCGQEPKIFVMPFDFPFESFTIECEKCGRKTLKSISEKKVISDWENGINISKPRKLKEC